VLVLVASYLGAEPQVIVICVRGRPRVLLWLAGTGRGGGGGFACYQHRQADYWIKVLTHWLKVSSLF